MKVAVIADVHANLVALRSVMDDVEAWQPDRVIVLGDLVNRGPRPAECLALVQERVNSQGWELVRGNHEEYVIQNATNGIPRSGPAFEVHRPSYWTYTRLGCDVTALQNMPLSLQLADPDGNEVSFYHGSILGLRDGIYPETADGPLAEKIGLHVRPDGRVPLAVFCVGHTHRPLVRRLQDTLVVNTGSAGLPFDGDTRPAYARLTWDPDGWQAEIVRLEYDLAAAERDFYQTGYLEEAGPLIRLVHRELLYAQSHLYTWALNYQELALRGEISVEESVRRHLAEYHPG
jgi:predicted phosphodiesterase